MKSTSRLGLNRKRVNPTAVWGVRWLKQWIRDGRCSNYGKTHDGEVCGLAVDSEQDGG
ncbi:hypothetical protein HanIR_Chr09g0398961 [Helianthus annuus]|nr:hypothetical protein HanIR_Chr09g0398961 [Helianthus annuus]